jgi:transcriptional regulator with XRE-family HTH domain
MTIHYRIEVLIKALGITKNQFSTEIGTSSAMISKITKNKVNFGVDILLKIINSYPQINADWLLKGIGEMFDNTVKSNFINQSADLVATVNTDKYVMNVNLGTYKVIQKNHWKLVTELRSMEGEYEGLFLATMNLKDYIDKLEDIDETYLNEIIKAMLKSDDYLKDNKFNYVKFKNDVLKGMSKIKDFKQPLIKLNKHIEVFCNEIKPLDILCVLNEYD